MSYLNYDKEPIKCVCKDCGKPFNKGDEGDNEEFCLRCEHLSISNNEEEGEF